MGEVERNERRGEGNERRGEMGYSVLYLARGSLKPLAFDELRSSSSRPLTDPTTLYSSSSSCFSSGILLGFPRSLGYNFPLLMIQIVSKSLVQER